MSELSKLQKRVNELNTIDISIDTSTTTNNNDTNTIFNIDTYNKIHKELTSNELILNEINNTLLIKVNKLISKADEKDIITGQPRYGNEKKKVIYQLKDDILKLQDIYQQYIPIILQKHQYLSIQKEQYDQQQYEQQLQLQQQLSSSTNDINTTNDHNHDNDNDNEETIRLAKLAELRREQKAQERHEKKMKRESLVSVVKDMIETYTTTNDNILKVFNNIKNNNDNDKCKKMIMMVIQLLDNISAHPDNDNLRKMRVTNTSLQDKLTGYIGGIELLVTIGFTPKVEDNDDEDIVSNTITTNTTNILVLSLCHDTNCNVILDMIEPNPEKDMDKWLSWYDGLKASKDYLEKLLKTIK
jgi:hypothetical protein